MLKNPFYPVLIAIAITVAGIFVASEVIHQFNQLPMWIAAVAILGILIAALITRTLLYAKKLYPSMQLLRPFKLK